MTGPRKEATRPRKPEAKLRDLRAQLAVARDEMRRWRREAIEANKDLFRAAQQLDWLEKNRHREIVIGPDGIKVWRLRYVTYWPFTGRTLRECIDNGMERL